MSYEPETSGTLDAAEPDRPASLVPPEAREEIESVLSSFRQWLLEAEQWRLALEPSAPQNGAEPVDLHTLLGELIALKQEVRLEARGGKTTRAELDRAIGEFRESTDKVRQHSQELLDPLVRDRDRLRDDLGRQLDTQERNWLELLIDLRDAIARGQESSTHAARRLGWRRLLVPRGLLGSLLEGYALALRRVDAVLESRGVREIECVGQPVDPERMRVVDVVHSETVEEGHVIDVVRCGYTYNNRVLRFAEVRAAARSQ